MEHNLTNIILLFTCSFTVIAHYISRQFAFKIYKIKHKDKSIKNFNFAYFMKPGISHSEKKIV